MGAGAGGNQYRPIANQAAKRGGGGFGGGRDFNIVFGVAAHQRRRRTKLGQPRGIGFGLGKAA